MKQKIIKINTLQLKEKIKFYLNNKPEKEIIIDFLFYE